MTGTSRRGRLLFVTAAGRRCLLASLALLPGGARRRGAARDPDLRRRADRAGPWLGRYDVARRTIRGHGLTRYMAAALLTGYAWLAVAGGLWASVGQMADGGAYDAECTPSSSAS